MVRYPSDEGSGHGRPDLLSFLGILGLSAVLLALPASRQAAVSDLLRQSVLRPFVAAHRWADRQGELRRRLQQLERANRELQQRLLRREGLAQENRELRDLLSLAVPRESQFLSADLMVGTPRLSRAGRFLVGVGRGDGVQPPVGVVVARGVVGVVRTAGEERAYGDLWTHPDFRVSVRTESGDATGVVRPVTVGEGGAAMLFEGAPYQRKIPEGTLLVTTGAGGIFPPGVPVGRVREISSVESGWARSYRVDPAVRPGTVHSVLVWRPPEGAAGIRGEVAGRGRPATLPPDSDTAPAPTPDTTVVPRLESVDPAGGAAAPAPSDSPPGVPDTTREGG